MQMIECINGSAWQIPGEIIHFENVKNFLNPNEMVVSKIYKKYIDDDFNTIVSHYSPFPITYVNFVLESKKGHVDPLGEILVKVLWNAT